MRKIKARSMSDHSTRYRKPAKPAKAPRRLREPRLWSMLLERLDLLAAQRRRR
jgi:hypothetical protein